MAIEFLVLYASVFALLWWLYLRRHRRVQQQHSAQLQQSAEAGLGEPPSLHPVVDPVRCLGSSSCVTACPEQALGIVNGKATLINASACIGHGACQKACPLDAITLVFGTEKRGIDIPNVSPHFETEVPGIFIAGELGGMGLIRKAAEQGRQAMDVIARRKGGDFEHDVVIVGAGPAGLSAGLAAIEHKLKYEVLEQEPSLGGAVFHYPRNKIAMTAPVTLALIGKVRFGEVQKERLIEFWRKVVKKTGLRVRFNECMQTIERDGNGLVVVTQNGRYRTRAVLLAMGRRGTPRKLEVPGEESAKVVYRLGDASQYAGQKVLVVGGGDSAVEAAVTLAERPDVQVTLSYRGSAFSRVKPKNRQRLEELHRGRRLQVELLSTVERIEPSEVVLKTKSGPKTLHNDAVIICAGGLLPTPLLQKIGISFQTKFGTA